MDIENREPQLIIKPNCSDNITVNQLPSMPRAHIIPATTKQTVFDAKVSNYFISTIQTHSTNQKCLEATLLGHELQGKIHKTDTLYDAFMMKDNDEVILTVLRKVEEIVDWRKDRLWGDTDGPYMNIHKCIQIQKALHDFE